MRTSMSRGTQYCAPSNRHRSSASGARCEVSTLPSSGCNHLTTSRVLAVRGEHVDLPGVEKLRCANRLMQQLAWGPVLDR